MLSPLGKFTSAMRLPSLISLCASVALLVGWPSASQGAAPSLLPQRPLDTPLELKTEPKTPPSKVAPKYQAQSKQSAAVKVTREQLKHNLKLTEMILNQAMLQEHWPTIADILTFYPDMEGHDKILEGYTRAALARHDGRYGEALAIYQQLLGNDPELDYVRLEMASTLYENNQLKDAEREFQRLSQRRIDIHAQRDIYLYRVAMVDAQQWKFSVAAGLGYDNNINSANPDRVLSIPVWQEITPEQAAELGVTGKRDEVLAALLRSELIKQDRRQRPIDAFGLRYRASADKEVNIAGHHYYSVGLGVSGVHQGRYASDYDDMLLSLQMGYHYKVARHWLSISPVAMKRWYGSQSYQYDAGSNFEYGYRVQPNWRVSLGYTWLKHEYERPEEKPYDGYLNNYMLSSQYFFTPSLALYGSLIYADEAAQERAYGSRAPAVMFGGYGEWPDLIGASLSARYQRQRFKARYRVFDSQRSDRVLSVNASLWKPEWQWWGVMPRLNVDYERVSSSIRAYERHRTRVALMVEKNF
ncbi:TPR repeat-containing protein [Carnimonas sp. R-84865]